MRILFLDCAPFIGGAQESFWTLVSEFHRRGVDIAMVCANSILERRATEANIPVTRIRASHWPANPAGLWRFWQERRAAAPVIQHVLEQYQPDFIHLNCLRAALLYPGLSSSCVIHDRDIRMPLLLPRWLARKHPRVIAISQAVAKKWRRCLPPNDLTVIPNAFHIDNIAATPRNRRHDYLTIACIADFSAWKGHEAFLEIFKRLAPHYPRLRAVIKGRVRDDEGREILNNLLNEIEAYGLSERVYVDDSAASALPFIAQADLIVSAATDEPFGRIAIEALALGKPIVAYDSGGYHDILADCPAATLVPPDNVDSLCFAVERLIISDDLGQTHPFARPTAQQFDVSRIIPRFLAFYGIPV